MSAKRKKHSAPVEDGRDKPDYAADLFRREDLSGKKESRQNKAKSKADDDKSSTVAEHLNEDLATRLRQMKESLVQQESKNAAAGAKSSQRRSSLAAEAARNNGARSAKVDEANKDTASFAELFDPAPDDEETFEEMLSNSKLDWQKFKG